jgi:hypothetical protein
MGFKADAVMAGVMGTISAITDVAQIGPLHSEGCTLAKQVDTTYSTYKSLVNGTTEEMTGLKQDFNTQINALKIATLRTAIARTTYRQEAKKLNMVATIIIGILILLLLIKSVFSR